jgi:hypothetical protein
MRQSQMLTPTAGWIGNLNLHELTCYRCARTPGSWLPGIADRAAAGKTLTWNRHQKHPSVRRVRNDSKVRQRMNIDGELECPDR